MPEPAGALPPLSSRRSPRAAPSCPVQLWMAVTASGSAEQIAVSSLISYDVYRTYINKKATGKQIIFMSRCVVIAYGILSGLLAIVLQ